MKYLLLLIPALLVVKGYEKLNDLKRFINNLDVKLNKIHGVKISVLKNTANFLVDATISNNLNESLNIETVGLVTLTKIYFYDSNGSFIGSGNVNISSININKGGDLKLQDVPFYTKLSNGFSKLKDFLKSPENSNILVELEFEAFGKIYKTTLK